MKTRAPGNLLLAPLLACSGAGSETGATSTSTSTTGETATTGESDSATTSATASTDATESDGTTAGSDTVASESEGESGPPPDPLTLQLFDEVVFYDGYAGLVDAPVPEGILRLSNALYTRRLSDSELDKIQTALRMDVVIGALCDNYDRIGSVNLALTPKGAEGYVASEVTRLELGRFITPFMDMNKEPDEVPYTFNVDHLVPILSSESVRAEYDLWVELEVFGVPYAANEEIPGCAGRNDVFRGSMSFYTYGAQVDNEFDVVIPIAAKEAYNNYAEGASDAIGTTTKTRPFTLEADAERVQLALITSNHGANAGGEEYVRRGHYVYLDMKLVHQYKPGRDTCEPFRMFNTQANGIYGLNPKTDAEWQAFSNWCPGDVIDIRLIDLGPLPAGEHSFVIDVPLAEFKGGQGDFPFSLFVQAKTAGG